jgi:riboflavin kinase / FMN adenylyltransferase
VTRFAVMRSPEEWTEHFRNGARTALSVGTFDGLHLGHQEILSQVLKRARANAYTAAVVTFDPHPVRILRPERAPQMIQTLPQRLAGLEQMGLDAALVLRFDRALSLLSPEEFVEKILIDRLRVAAILVGANFSFGHRGAGKVDLLTEIGKKNGFEVQVVAPVTLEGRMVSSTTIRNDVATGQVAEATRLLGRPFALTGGIRTGEGRGRTILFPTLNLVPEQELLPKLGVYATESVVSENVYRSVTNVGTRPTFEGKGVTVESHLFGFDQQIMSGPMEVRFHARLRDEQKFSGPEALRAQIANDIATARAFFSSTKVEKSERTSGMLPSEKPTTI